LALIKTRFAVLSQYKGVFFKKPGEARLFYARLAVSFSMRWETYSGEWVFLASSPYTVGTTISVSSIEHRTPKNTTAPIDWRDSAPAPVANSSGTEPNAAHMLVISK